MEIGRTDGGSGFDSFSYPDYLDLREAPGLARLSAYNHAGFSYASPEGGERVFGMFVTASYFDVLGSRPLRGRYFLPAEDEADGVRQVAIVSHTFWQERLEGDPDVVGTSITLNRQPLTVVGVTPPEFHGHVGPVRAEVWVPLRLMPLLDDPSVRFDDRGAFGYALVGKLAEGASVASVQTAAAGVMRRVSQAFPDSHEGIGAEVTRLTAIPAVGRSFLTVFFGALSGLVLLVLLVTCANVAGTLLARATARQREIAVRLSLGSSRARLVRQLVTEAVLLFTAGGVAGLGIAILATRFLSRLTLPVPIPVFLDLSPHPGVLALGMALALGTGLLFGLAPALQATRPDLVYALKLTAGGAEGRGLLQRAFVVGQVALTVLLVAASGLFLRAIRSAQNVDAGFLADAVVVTDVDLDLDGVATRDQGVELFDRILSRVAALPGAEAAAIASDLPLDGSRASTGLRPAGTATESAEIGADFASVSPGYFETLRIPVLAGRGFTRRDLPQAEPVVVVSESLARRLWPAGDPLGQRLIVDMGGTPDPERTVVGVVSDVKTQFIMETPNPALYFPLAQEYQGSAHVVVRGPEGGASLASGLRAAILSADRSLSVGRVLSLAELTTLGVLPQRIGARVLSALGLIAVLLSGLGIYGVIAYRVARRTREFGIRMALGARATDVVTLVLRNAAVLAAVGGLIGLPLAVGVGFLMRGMLLGVHPLDPVALAAVVGFVAILVVAGGLAPALRAARVEPATALRYE